MCHLRGLLMVKLSRSDQAKHCFMEALSLDVKCYESFHQLISGEMMTPDEGALHCPRSAAVDRLTFTDSLEWEFVQSLAYKEQTPADAEFIQLMYTSRLRKYKHLEEHALARKRLVEEFGLSDNPDVLFSFADALYAQFRWADCYAITSRLVFHPMSELLTLICYPFPKNIGTCSSPCSHYAPAYSLLIPSSASTLKTIHFGARARGQGTGVTYQLVCCWCMVYECQEIQRREDVLQVGKFPPSVIDHFLIATAVKHHLWIPDLVPHG